MTNSLSIIIPVYNEEENLNILHNKLKTVLSNTHYEYEIIYIDDCSTDNSFKILQSLKDDNTKIMKFNRNFGQTAALQAGINHSKGNIIITLDADLQNNPEDILKIAEEYNKGYDLVSGWRKNRQDNFIKTIPSKIANIIISKITKTKLHDTGCTLKAYNGDILRKINLFADQHRFIPTIFAEYSSKITEIEVSHHPRIYGKSKYNIFRTFRVIIDLLAISYWKKFRNKPMYFFGNIAFSLLFISVLSLILLAVNLFSTNLFISNSILLMLSAIFFCNAIVIFSIGLLFENELRTNLKQNKEQIYVIETIL